MFKTDKSKLEAEIRGLKDELADAKQELKHTKDEINHLTKLNEEREELDRQKFEVNLRAETSKEIAELKDKHQEDLIGLQKTELTRMQEMFDSVLARLPDVSARLKGSV